MYGLINKITAVAGQRAALAQILIDGTGNNARLSELRSRRRLHGTRWALGHGGVGEPGQSSSFLAASSRAGGNRQGAAADRWF